MAFVDDHDNYRVRHLGDGLFQAEMAYICGPASERLWIPLDDTGYWADADAYSTGRVTKSSPMTRAHAKQAMFKAMEINRVHL